MPMKPENANTYATSRVPNGIPPWVKRLSAKRANPEKSVLNANVNAKNCHNIGPSFPSLNDSMYALHLEGRPCSVSGVGCGATAGSKKYVQRTLVSERAAAARIGYVWLNCAR